MLVYIEESSIFVCMDDYSKISSTVDALFGMGASSCMPHDITMTYSRTGRIREVRHNNVLLCTLRIDGGLAITVNFAHMLLRRKELREYCVEIDDDAAPFVADGRSVMASHVTHCGRHVRVSSDVPILYKGSVVAVGRAVLSGPMITGARRGVAVRVRDSLKRSNHTF